MKIAISCTAAAILLSATIAMAMPQAMQQDMQQRTGAQPANQSSLPSAPQPTGQAPEKPARKGPQAKTKAEFDAYKSAAALSDPAKLEAAATDFAQRFPDSELRPFLFQQAMGMYQQANNQAKALEMARDVLKYDPNNPVALLTSAQILAERTHEEDLDRDARLTEASTNAQAALQHSNDLTPPQGMTPEQFAAALAQIRGTAHEVLATVAFKKQDYFTAINEYNLAITEEKQHTDPVVWLRLAVAHDKNNDYQEARAAAQKAIDTSQAGSQVRTLAEQEKSRLDTLAPVKSNK